MAFIHRAAPSAMIALLLGAGASSTVAGEGPTEGTCDETDLLVCAGADAAASVTCVFKTTNSVACSWTRGVLWSGFSPVLLPGEVDASASAAVRVCVNQACQTEDAIVALPSCAWLPALDCVDAFDEAGDVGPVQLELGQCLKVTVTQSITVQARVVNQAVTLASVAFSNAGEGADEECVLDDGR